MSSRVADGVQRVADTGWGIGPVDDCREPHLQFLGLPGSQRHDALGVGLEPRLVIKVAPLSSMRSNGGRSPPHGYGAYANNCSQTVASKITITAPPLDWRLRGAVSVQRDAVVMKRVEEGEA